MDEQAIKVLLNTYYGECYPFTLYLFEGALPLGNAPCIMSFWSVKKGGNGEEPCNNYLYVVGSFVGSF